MTTLHVVVPEGVDDPTRPSGGNAYDLRVCRGLRSLGWSVLMHPLPGNWPAADAQGRAALDALLDGLDDTALVLVDGLIASTVPESLVPQSTRLRVFVLMHMPLGASSSDPLVVERERQVVHGCTGVIATSTWTRAWLTAHYAVPATRIHVATPGVDPAPPVESRAQAGRLLCVAAVTPTKGQDILLDALQSIADLPWSCRLVGSVTRDPAFAEQIRHRTTTSVLSGRVTMSGPLVGSALDEAYAYADLVVLPSRAETYGMVITEALARGIPVIATQVGGTSEALGSSEAHGVPGLLVPPDDPAATAAALTSWLEDEDLRARLRRAAAERRRALQDWSHTSAVIARALTQAAA